jgi:hypothetical protein
MDEPVDTAPDAAAKSARPGGEGRTLSVTELLRTAREVDDALAPVHPDAAFRAALYADLIVAARRQHAHRLLYGEPEDADFGEDGSSRRLVWGAAAVGLGSAVSVLGALAYYWRRRGRKAA